MILCRRGEEHGDTRPSKHHQDVRLVRARAHAYHCAAVRAWLAVTSFRYESLEISGGTLADLIRDQRGAYMATDTVMMYFVQMALALRYVHEQKRTMHRDLKPANILLNKKRTMVKLSGEIY